MCGQESQKQCWIFLCAKYDISPMQNVSNIQLELHVGTAEDATFE